MAIDPKNKKDSNADPENKEDSNANPENKEDSNTDPENKEDSNADPENKEDSNTVRYSQDEDLNSLLSNVVTDLSKYAERMLDKIKKLSDVGRALSGEPEINQLLKMIVYEARDFTNADAGTLYTLEDNHLKFKIIQNDSLNIKMGGRPGDEIPFPPVPLKETNVSAYAAIHQKAVNVEDVYTSDLFDFTGPKKFDESAGYRTKSMLVVPLLNHENDVIGVLQLINATNPNDGKLIAFTADNVYLTESLASQAAVAITNVNLISSMEELFEAFVGVMATAIDEKSPVTGGHIKRVANLTMTFANILNDTETGPFEKIAYSPDQLYELKIAALMHDIGKVTTPVDVVEKGKKLQTIFNRIEHVDLRFLYLIQQRENEGLQSKVRLMEQGASEADLKIWGEEFQEQIAKLKEMREFVLSCNNPGEFMQDESLQRLKEISQLTYKDHEGKDQPYLTEDELVNLSIRKGSITERERKIMQNHAAVTLKMLEKIPFTKKLKNIPHFAGAHHEFVNGKGYPLGLKGDEIPFSGRLMAVTDIAEALTASDRPYKKAMPLPVVYKILNAMVKDGELDKDLVDFFIKEDVYGKYKELHETPKNGDSPKNGDPPKEKDAATTEKTEK